MSVFEVPLSPQPQQFPINLAGTSYTLLVKWCIPAACWVLDILDSNDAPIVRGIPLITGSDLLEQLTYLGIGGQLIVQTDSNADAVPTYENLGEAGRLYFVTP